MARIGKRWVDEASVIDCPRCGRKLVERFALYRVERPATPTEAPHRRSTPYKIFCRWCGFKQWLGRRRN